MAREPVDSVEQLMLDVANALHIQVLLEDAFNKGYQHAISVLTNHQEQHPNG
jgi:hypothetical protein